MTNDRELLELAARAAGINGRYGEKHPEFGEDWIDTGVWYTDEDDCTTCWNPIQDDGDALRLGVIGDVFSDPRFFHERDVAMFTKGMDKQAATRWAITKVMAERQRAKEAQA